MEDLGAGDDTARKTLEGYMMATGRCWTAFMNLVFFFSCFFHNSWLVCRRDKCYINFFK